jgi:hypothetical protein
VLVYKKNGKPGLRKVEILKKKRAKRRERDEKRTSFPTEKFWSFSKVVTYNKQRSCLE